MFSGIVEEMGRLKKASRRANITLLEIEADKVIPGTRIGDSILVDGACLTVVACGPGSLSFEVMPETMKTANFSSLRITGRVNLERSLKVGDRLSGHFVTGHIDCAGVIRSKGYTEGNLCFEIAIPAGFTRYILPKGSIAVNGVSLTLAGRKSNCFSVYIIPHTLKNTNLGQKEPSDKVNVEFDILAKGSSPFPPYKGIGQ